MTADSDEVKRLAEGLTKKAVEPICVFCGKSLFDPEHCGLGGKVGWDAIVRPLKDKDMEP